MSKTNKYVYEPKYSLTTTMSPNFACMGGMSGVTAGYTTCVGPGNYTTTTPNVMAIYSTMAACQADTSCGVSGVTNFACMAGIFSWNTTCVGPGNYNVTNPNVMAIYSTMADCQSGPSCGMSGTTGNTTTGNTTTGNTITGNTINVNIQADSFNELINTIIQKYPGINVDNTMKFSKIKTTVIEYIRSLTFCTNNTCSFTVNVGILPQPIKKQKLNCKCRQTTSGKYKTESECLSSNDPKKLTKKDDNLVVIWPSKKD
jgi:hypothetical protein